MWEVPGQGAEVRDADGNLVIDPAEQHELVQANGQPWFIAWHALQVLEANLTGYFVPWEPWSGFGGKSQDDVTTLAAPWSRADMLAYIDYCRERARYALEEFMDERAATPVGGNGHTYADRVIAKIGHVVEHATQIRQFIDWTASGLIADAAIHSPTEGRWAQHRLDRHESAPPGPPSPFVISYFASDLAAARRFYEDVIGLPVNSDLPDVYFLAGAGPWRLQFLQVEPARPGRDTVSSGLVLLGLETPAELEALHARLRSQGLREDDGYRDPDGRIVIAQLYNPARSFHD